MDKDKFSRWLIIFCLVITGEIIFSLPFHVPRYFRPTVLDVFDLSNTGLGDVFAIYGITAMLSYFPGGAIADRFSARKLMSVSLIATALGGLYLAQIPGTTGLMFLFAYWGVTSILLFWAALIRTTREWGGHLAQGKAFGILDGGRGLVAAAGASLGVILFSYILPDDISNLTAMQRQAAMQGVIYYYTLLTLMAGLLVWFMIPDRRYTEGEGSPFTGMQTVLKQKVVWLQSLIVVCAYCGYKGLDNYALYMVEVLGMNEVDSARMTSLSAYLRPIAAISAGILVDRSTGSRVIIIAFALLIFSYAILSFSAPAGLMINIIYLNLVLTFIAVFAIRGVYFALIEETAIPRSLTGTAVGLISVIGFTPDVFFAAIAGRILDAAPGLAGHQHYFLLLTLIAVTGMITAYLLARHKNFVDDSPN